MYTNWIKILLLLLSYLITLVGCSSRRGLIPNDKYQARTHPYGSFIELKLKNDSYYGELIAFDNVQVWILTDSGVRNNPLQDLEQFNIVLTKKKTKAYSKLLGYSLIPSLAGALIHPEYAESFLAVGCITVIAGGLAVVIESGRKNQILTYPTDGNDMMFYSKYARFPLGIPPNVDINTLKPWWNK
ncbi:hypothetical protein [Labilibacter marinus]|uniref:hypothetical protein n=1 Tax=Labilibacter marinus TaxID=1477105 RepID=UPI00082A383B|nr:hypothetical protein [Labilibacter marinus]